MRQFLRVRRVEGGISELYRCQVGQGMLLHLRRLKHLFHPPLPSTGRGGGGHGEVAVFVEAEVAGHIR